MFKKKKSYNSAAKLSHLEGFGRLVLAIQWLKGQILSRDNICDFNSQSKIKL